ncbi:MAG TPA: acyl-CoA thioesterase domain-containing protein [Acidimicrobiales bacterium]
MEPVTGRPSPYRARAWWGDQLVADSTAAVRVEAPDQPPALFFPCTDIRLDLFRDEGRTATDPVLGEVRLWGIAGAGASRDPAGGAPGAAPGADDGGWHGDRLDQSDGRDVLRGVVAPPPELAWLSGLAAFDHDRVRIELEDGRPGDDPRDVTVKRFPTWGDAADLIDIMDVRPAGEGTYVSVARSDGRRPVVEGSQMLGQAIVAAGRHAPGRRAVSAHMVFLRAADARQPLLFTLEELTAGRTFTTLSVTVSQRGRAVARGTLLLDATAPDVIRHAADPPDAPGPYDSEPYDMGVTGRDLRVAEGAYTDDPDAPVGPPVIDAWVRFREVPDDPYLHAGLLAQFTGHMSIAAALRPHAGIGQRQAHRTLSTAINAITLSLHADVRADDWMLYHHLSTFGGDGMTHSECRVHDRAGRLLASFTVEAMVRGFPGGGAAADDRTAL